MALTNVDLYRIDGTIGSVSNISTSSLNGGPLAGTRNRIINGDMRIAQRGTSFASNGYTLDRWTFFNSGGTANVSQQTADSTDQPENGMPNFLRISRVSPSGILYLSQKIEDVSLYDGFAVTVSFYAKANTNITLPIRLIQEFGSGGSTAVTVGTVNTSVTTSWAKYTANFTLPSLSGKTIGTSSYLELAFDTPATYSTLDITGVQLETGTVATPFERRSIGQELALCQRYFEKKNYNSTAYERISTAFVPGTSTSTLMETVFTFTEKRALPSVTTSAGNTFRQNGGNALDNIGTSVSVGTIGLYTFNLAVNGNSRNSGTVGWISRENVATTFIEISAEL